MKRLLSIMMVIAMLFVAVACQVTPENPIVVKKDTERMIEQAAGTQSGSNLTTLGVPAGRYRFDSTGLSGRLQIMVDAEIQLPDTDDIPIIRVSSGRFSQETVTAAFNYLFPDDKPYDVSNRILTKADIEKFLLECKKKLADGSYATDFGYTDEEYREFIASWEAELETAPDSVPDMIRSDGLMHLEMKENIGNFYNLDVSTIKDKADSNSIDKAFSVITADPSSRLAVNSGFGDYLYYNNYSYNPGAKTPIDYVTFVGRTDGTNLPDEASKQLTVSFQEAKGLCDSFFRAVNLSDEYCFASAFLVNDRTTGQADGKYVNGQYVPATIAEAQNYAYKLYYSHRAAGIPVFENADWGLTDSGFSVPWSYECVCLIVDNHGLRKIEWTNPIAVGETVLDSSALMSFDEIISIFEVMIKTKYEAMINSFWGEQGKMEVAADAVQLCLVRIREQDTDGLKGLLVPAWVFYGNNKVIDADGRVSYNFTGGGGSNIPKEPFPLLVINAIDGSIIDLLKGY